MTRLLIMLFGLSFIYASSMTRVEAYIRVLTFQGFVLFGMVLLDAGKMPALGFIILCAETLVLKAILIPSFLMYTVRKNRIWREEKPSISSFYSVFITSVIFASGLSLSFWAAEIGGSIKPLYFGVSLSAVITGLYFIISRKKLITHVMGYVMMENGIFLLALSMASEMPVIVSMGVLLDLFAAIFMLGVFITKINDTFDELHIDSLSNLKD